MWATRGAALSAPGPLVCHTHVGRASDQLRCCCCCCLAFGHFARPDQGHPPSRRAKPRNQTMEWVGHVQHRSVHPGTLHAHGRHGTPRARARPWREGGANTGGLFSLPLFFFCASTRVGTAVTAVPTSKNTEAGRLSPPTFCWCAAGLLVIGPQLFKMKFLTFLYLNHNGLTFVPPEICELRSLTLVDLSHNKLRYRCRAQPRDRFATQHTHQPRPAPVHPGTPARNPNVAASRSALTGC